MASDLHSTYSIMATEMLDLVSRSRTTALCYQAQQVDLPSLITVLFHRHLAKCQLALLL